LGARRQRLITEATAGIQQLRDLLECAWPGVLEAAADPFESINWCAALAVVLDRCNGQPEQLARLGLARFEARWWVSCRVGVDLGAGDPSSPRSIPPWSTPQG
jgi:hypothetical protein